MRILVVARYVVALIAMSSAIGLPFCIGQEAKPFIVTAEMERQGQGSEPAFPLVDLFDVDKNGRLNYSERLAARKHLKDLGKIRKANPRRPFEPATAGPKVDASNVPIFDKSIPLYAPKVLRTLFLRFEGADWEEELAAFWHTDVKVDASLLVDNQRFDNVGVNFRGNSSFTGIPDGSKRSMSLDLDFVEDQNLLGHRQLKLLNANQDPTFLRSVLYLMVARDYFPTLDANLVRVVINGESWGIYVNQQTFSSEFMAERVGAPKGTRWKSPNNSIGGGLAYLGEDVELYRRWYEIKGKDSAKGWNSLIAVCKVLNETPPEQLEARLKPILDVDQTLKFLALDMALVNGDGYWNDGSDFNLYLDSLGVLHLTVHDANEGFRGGRDGSTGPDPLTAMNDEEKALRTKLLASPVLRERYLQYVGEIAVKWLDWNRIGPIIGQYESLIAEEVGKDSRKHSSTESFRLGLYGNEVNVSTSSIKGFVVKRQAFLLGHPDVIRALTSKGNQQP